jgi:hypothetical protein
VRRTAAAGPGSNGRVSVQCLCRWRARRPRAPTRACSHPVVDRFGNYSSRIDPAGGSRKPPPAPANPRNDRSGTACSRLESPPIPAQPGSAMTGLPRRRSRVRVPSLPPQKYPQIGNFPFRKAACLPLESGIRKRFGNASSATRSSRSATVGTRFLRAARGGVARSAAVYRTSPATPALTGTLPQPRHVRFGGGSAAVAK